VGALKVKSSVKESFVELSRYVRGQRVSSLFVKVGKRTVKEPAVISSAASVPSAQI